MIKLRTNIPNIREIKASTLSGILTSFFLISKIAALKHAIQIAITAKYINNINSTTL